MLPVRTPVNSPERSITMSCDFGSGRGSHPRGDGTAARERGLTTDLQSASQYDEVVAPRGERLSLEPAVDGLDLEPREPQHQLQLSAPDDADGELVHTLVLQLALPTVQL